LLIIGATLRHALFLGEVAVVMEIQIAQRLPCRRICALRDELAAA
jgi:hypothetical protein